MPDEINKRIAEYRRKAGLNQATAAEKLNIKRSTYARMEAAGKKFDSDIIDKMCDLFNVSADELIRGKEPKKETPTPFNTVHSDDGNLILASPSAGLIAELQYEPDDDERHLMHLYHSFTKDEKKQVTKLIYDIYKSRRDIKLKL